MKNLNKVSFILLFLIGSFLFTSDAEAGDFIFRRRRPLRNGPIAPQPRPRRPVGAPLDAGLLAILGAAGVGYYVTRKKNNKEKE